MVTVHDVDATKLIETTAKELKQQKSLIAPEWALFSKTGNSAERPPIDAEWWYIRGAAVLRKINRVGPIGVQKLKVHYGGRRRRGHKRPRVYDASGNAIRKILQQLEKAGLVKQEEAKGHRGRVITGKGRSFLDNLASKMQKQENYEITVNAQVEEAKPVEVKVEVKSKVEKQVVEKVEAKQETTTKEETKKEDTKPVEAKKVEEKK